MRYFYSFLVLMSIYLLVQIFGAYIGSSLITEIEEGEIRPIVQPEKPESSLWIFAGIIVMTAILLLFLKFGLDRIIRIMIMFALFGGSTLSLLVFTDNILFSLAGSLLLLMFWRRRMFKPPSAGERGLRSSATISS